MKSHPWRASKVLGTENALGVCRVLAMNSLILFVSSVISIPRLIAQESGSKANSTLYVDTLFENASPLWYEIDARGALQIHLLYDHERDSPNRAAGHFHFRIHGAADQRIRVEFNNLSNVWNSTPGSVARELLAAVVSDDGRDWRSIPLEPTEDGRVFGVVELNHGSQYVARVEPYRISDLRKLMARIEGQRDVAITKIGETVEGRNLEMIRIGRDEAENQVFLRARAHPWEAGGNWVVEGVLETLLSEGANRTRFLESMCVHILPMANLDGVARGRTRFNSMGKDLNRDWNLPTIESLCPENYALEKWLQSRIQSGRAPDLALELHNDGNGKLHISRPPGVDLEKHIERMEFLESLLRRYTWFTEGSTKANYRNAGTLGEGWLMRFGIDAAVHEFNCNIIAATGERPMAKHWKAYGNQLPLVLVDYFKNRPQ
jgi:hypothetical protein